MLVRTLYCYYRQEAYTVIGANCKVCLFKNRTEDTEVPVSEHVFLQSYFVNKLMRTSYELITSGLKQLSSLAFLNCKCDLIVAS